MRRIYESFQELGDTCTKGDSIFHGLRYNKHNTDPCLAWQEGVQQFAEMLDKYVKFPKDGVEFKDCLKEYKTKVKIYGNKAK